MKVLVTGFDWHGDLVPFVVRGFAGIASEVRVLLTNSDMLQRERARTLTRLESVPVAGRLLAGRWRTKLAHDTITAINERFAQETSSFRPDVVLSILCWGEPLTAAGLARSSGATTIGWLMDDPFGYEGSRLEPLLTAYDRIYSVDDGWSDNVELATGRRPAWLPCGADLTTHHPVEPNRRGETLADHIVYVGSSCIGHPSGTIRRSLIESLRGLPLAIFGDEGWRRQGDFAASCYRGGPVSTERANVIYASGAIALNVHHPQFRKGTSQRTFALCASGAFQLVDWRDGLDAWLAPGRELETFRTPAELRALAERYLADPLARRHIAAAGRSRVLAQHTYAHRVKAMIVDLGMSAETSRPSTSSPSTLLGVTLSLSKGEGHESRSA